MTTLWDDLKKSMKIWGSAAAEKAEEFGKAAAVKTEELTKIGKIKLEILQLKRDLDKNYAGLGKHVFESAESNVTNFAGNEQFLDYIKKAQDLLSQIQQKEKRIIEIKEETESVDTTVDTVEDDDSSEEDSKETEKS